MRADDRCQGNISKGSQVSPGVKTTFSCAAAVSRIGRALWQRLLRRSASESGRLRQGAGDSEGGNRCRRGLVLAMILQSRAALQRSLDAFLHFRGARASTPSRRTVLTMPPVDFVSAGQWRALLPLCYHSTPHEGESTVPAARAHLRSVLRLGRSRAAQFANRPGS